MPTIENELHYYDLSDKVVYCNCDDESSNFVKYFSQAGSCKDLIYTNSDFRIRKNINVLKKVDVVVTNPPFSLFREYIQQLMEYNKRFLVLGNLLSFSCKEIFPHIMQNKIWFGVSIKKGDIQFRMPEYYPLTSKNGAWIGEDGNKYVKVTNIRWFTNMEHYQDNSFLKLTKRYTLEKYPRYDNYDAIDVKRTNEIPKDYDAVMGVPLTFMDKYNPRQFEILGLSKRECNYDVPFSGNYDDYWEQRQDGSRTGITGTCLTGKPILQGNNSKNNYYINKDGRIVQCIFPRLFVRRRKEIMPQNKIS